VSEINGNRLYRVLLRGDTAPVTLLLSTLQVAMGGWFLLPLDTFGTGSTYDTMARLAPEWAWGLLLVLNGILLGCGVLILSTTAYRLWVSLLSASIWLVMAVATAHGSNLAGMSTALYSVLSIAAGWLYVREALW
jgi:hypothetical protein